jgi:hypothetical protein
MSSLPTLGSRATTKKSACLVVTGAYLTQCTRELVIGEQWEKALRFLEVSLHCGIDIAIEIASGQTKLVGENHVETEEEDDTVRKEYLKEIGYIYRGRFEKSLGGGRIWIRPVACVTDFGYGDVYCTPKWREPDSRAFHECGESASSRAGFYCQHQGEWALGSCTVPSLGRRAQVIGEMCPSAPSWFPKLTLEMAVRQIEALEGDLEQRGWMKYLEKYGPPEGSLWAASPVRIMHANAAEHDAGEPLDPHVEFEDVRRKVRERTRDEDWYPFERKLDGQFVYVPRDAFFHCDMEEQEPYHAVADYGMRMQGDVPAHTDWMCAASTDDPLFVPWEKFKELTEIGYFECYAIHEAMYATDLVILSKASDISLSGRIVHPKKGETVPADCIAIIPYASADYVQAACTALATITEVGGSFSHLVVYSEGRAVVRVEGALKKYPVGTQIVLDLVGRKISIVENEGDQALREDSFSDHCF